MPVRVHFENCAMWLIGALFLLVYTQQTLPLIGCWKKALRLLSKDDNARIFCSEFALSFFFAPLRTLRAEITICEKARNNYNKEGGVVRLGGGCPRKKLKVEKTTSKH
jgi:hypothetical protein